MKIRSSFVSNSSSSSYICVICGHEEGGRDIGLSECSMVQGKSTGDVYCERHIHSELIGKYIKKLTTVLDEDLTKAYAHRDMLNSIGLTNSELGIKCVNLSNKEVYNEYRTQFLEAFVDEIPTEVCPMEQLTFVSDHTALDYMLNKSEFTNKDQLLTFLKNTFDVYTNVKKHIDGK